MRRLTAVAIAGVLSVSLIGTANAGKPALLWEDPPGDADAAQGLGQSIPAGFDLVSGSVAKNGANLEFNVVHADMLPSGSFPEGARFLWAFSVNGTYYRLTAKSADIGKPDVLAGETTERVGTVSATGHFRLEGDCALGKTIALFDCKPLAYITGSIDTATKTITLVVPMAAVKAKTGSLIGPGNEAAAGICQICWITHVAERSSPFTIIDLAVQGTTYKVPKK